MSFAASYDRLSLSNIEQISEDALASPYTEEDSNDRFYKVQHQFLVDLFRNSNLEDDAAFGQCALAVYGWMPRILRAYSVSDDLKQELMELKNREIEDISSTDFLGGSVIGSSKFLHFTRPDRFPIWDANVARALAFRSRWGKTAPAVAWATINSTARYRTYTEAMRIPSDYEIRDKEFALFRIGKKMRVK